MFSCRHQQMESMTIKYPGGGERDADVIVNSMLQYPKEKKHLIHLKSKCGGALPFLFKINDDEHRHAYTVFYNSNLDEVEYTLEDKKALHDFITHTLTLNKK